MKSKRTISFYIAACVLWICGAPALPGMPGQAGPAVQTDTSAKPKKAKKSHADTSAAPSTPEPVKNASASEIQEAKSSGKVWVNTESGVYHKSGRWFGTTKQGKFMTESEAVKAGYKAAKNEK